jgi:hypothetical protein
MAMRWAFFKGVDVTEQKYIAAMGRALEQQLAHVRTVQEKDLAIVSRAVEQEGASVRQIDALPDPVGGVGSDDWLRSFNAAVRTAQHAPGPVDE